MNTPQRYSSNTEPRKFQNLGTGYWYYNYDIQTEEKTEVDPETEETTTSTIYTFIPVRTKGKPTYSKCVELLIREYISESQEFDLVNTAYRANNGLLDEEDSAEAIAEYEEYLNTVINLKANIKADFA